MKKKLKRIMTRKIKRKIKRKLKKYGVPGLVCLFAFYNLIAVSFWGLIKAVIDNL